MLSGQRGQHRLQITGQRGAELDLLTGAGQPNADPFRSAGTCEGSAMLSPTGAVDFITDDGVA